MGERNPPREYDLSDPQEIRRLLQECHGYLVTCHHKHGTDWEGRQFAIDALNQYLDGRPTPVPPPLTANQGQPR